MNKKPIYGWHFVGATLRDGAPVPAEGEWLEYTGAIKICASGLHGSRTPYDAFRYAPGATLCYCEFEGVEQEQNDKFVARRRKIVAKGDATEASLYFARMQALSCIDAWDAPDEVLDYLAGDEDKKSAARSAAESAAWGAAWSAAESAARSAAWGAAGSAVESAAWSAARSAARSAFNELIYECFEDVLK